MAERPVIVLGAGATKACGGPLTDEILPAALNGKMVDDERAVRLQDREELLALASAFLSECFNVPHQRPVAREDCPSLPMVLSMLKRSASSGLPIGTWSAEKLVKAKRAIEYAIFAVIEAALRRIPADRQWHRTLLEPLYERGIEPCVISLNYDVIVDNAMFGLGELHQQLRAPDYRLDVATERYIELCGNLGTFGQLLKLHGSLNWLYCEKCQRLDFFVTRGMGGGVRAAKALGELYHSAPFDDAYSCRGTRCRNHPACDGFVVPVLITPTFVKDYDNPHVHRVWAEAEQAMRQADRAVIIGYSLPTDDVEMAMLLKRGLGHLDAGQITVVEFVKGDEAKFAAERTKLSEHPVGQRYRSVLGPNLDWHTVGFAGWLREQKQAGGFPFDAN